MQSYSKEWNELADIKDELAERDWFYGTSGNLSIKVNDNPLQFLVTASGKDKRKRTPEDFLLVDAEGNPAEDTQLKPSAETLIHCEIYKRTSAGCCLHVHTVDNNVISELYAEQGSITFRNQELIKAFGIWDEEGEVTLPIVANPAHIPTLTEGMLPYLSDAYYGVLIRNHGITVWGKDGKSAKKHLEAFEFLFQYHLKIKSFSK